MTARKAAKIRARSLVPLSLRKERLSQLLQLSRPLTPSLSGLIWKRLTQALKCSHARTLASLAIPPSFHDLLGIRRDRLPFLLSSHPLTFKIMDNPKPRTKQGKYSDCHCYLYLEEAKSITSSPALLKEKF